MLRLYSYHYYPWSLVATAPRLRGQPLRQVNVKCKRLNVKPQNSLSNLILPFPSLRQSQFVRGLNSGYRSHHFLKQMRIEIQSTQLGNYRYPTILEAELTVPSALCVSLKA